MSKIQVLDEATANQIAAGEVVERPVSVAKELVENSLDAGASRITVELIQGGLSGIKVIDNGSGMSPEDAKLCFQRHATSKIKTAGDLTRILTLGFRGEALPSIASVAKVTLVTRTRDDLAGTEVRMEGGQLLSVSPAGCPVGTTIDVQELFYNTPARRKHLKSPNAEAGQISDLFAKLALARPDVRMELRSSGRVIFCSPGNGSLRDAAASVFGPDNVRSMIELNHQGRLLSIRGFISKPVLTRASRQYQNFYINQRYIRSAFISSLLLQAYQTLIPAGRFPLALLHIALDPEQVDVNVHPTKMEVRLAREKELAEELLEIFSGHLHVPAAVTGLWEMMPGRKGKPPADKSPDYKEPEPYKENPSSVLKNKTLVQEKPAETPFINSRKGAMQTQLPLPGKTVSREEFWPKPNQQGEFPVKPTVPEPAPIKKEPLLLETTPSYSANAVFASLRPVGQVFPTYVLAQGEGGLYIIDQHAAHERVYYEKYKEQLTRGVQSQMLLEPIPLDIPYHHLQRLIANVVALSDMGFVVEHFGGDTFLLRGAPPGTTEKPAELLMDLLDRLQDSPAEQLDNGMIIDRLAAAMACRDAVKAGTRLGPKEIQSLLEGLSRCHSPYTCPHGRPTLIQITQEELNKRFKR